MGMFVHSQQLSLDVISLLNGIQSTGSYRLRLASDGKSLEWVTMENGIEVTYKSEPEVSFGTRLKMWFLAPLVSEKML